ncbi:hypothetical protein RhiirC2_111104 [Rhizophagus irregularis]|uniref:Uncharacterized protein n=1 Tax=Rhizophagus irregularis TaxID=588596 RepID=A0A2N1P2N0_9GLOM|nr:hypothetical protein RhiirC2_111104 [Rhizophagus irregularis]
MYYDLDGIYYFFTIYFYSFLTLIRRNLCVLVCIDFVVEFASIRCYSFYYYGKIVIIVIIMDSLFLYLCLGGLKILVTPQE